MLINVQRDATARTNAGISLAEAHRRTYPVVLEWLENLGRVPGEKNTSNKVGDDSQVPRVTLSCGPKAPSPSDVVQRAWGLTRATQGFYRQHKFSKSHSADSHY